MIPDANITWYEANQRHLALALGEVRAALERLFPPEPGAPVQEAEMPAPAAGTEAPRSPPAALQTLCAAFGLSDFERGILLLCAGAEMDSRFGAICSRAHRDQRRALPTFSLALAALPDGHWTALTPTRPLRFWHLVDVLGGDSLTGSPLRIQERILHYLAGVSCLDERLQPLVKPADEARELAPSHQAIADELAAAWSEGPAPILELCGNDAAGKRAVAAAACALRGQPLHVVSASALPHGAAEMESFVRLWERESLLTGSALLLECDDADGHDGPDRPAGAAATALLESLQSPLLISTRAPRRCAHRAVLIVDVARPADQVWEAAPATVRSRLDGDGLAQRIVPAAGWDDLVLAEQQKQVLKHIVLHVQHRAQVYTSWGFAAKSSRGLGISALFAGPSGTGKTMAAEVLAEELGLDLYRIDLSQVVSKYIGETEKNLRRVFDAADESAAILLFDEADALFGKRSDVKDSHDRYANIEVSYLLQRMEAYHGLAILTTNRKTALDQAFLRRIRFVVEFPFPEAAQRAEIWRRVFPRMTPTADLQIDRLARLSAAGGNIRNIALNAAFLAAHEGQPVRMAHLLRAARSEFTKMEKPLTDAEVAGWV
jgi:AAA+ superfamily predicted ATPase